MTRFASGREWAFRAILILSSNDRCLLSGNPSNHSLNFCIIFWDILDYLSKRTFIDTSKRDGTQRSDTSRMNETVARKLSPMFPIPAHTCRAMYAYQIVTSYSLLVGVNIVLILRSKLAARLLVVSPDTYPFTSIRYVWSQPLDTNTSVLDDASSVDHDYCRSYLHSSSSPFWNYVSTKRRFTRGSPLFRVCSLPD